MSKVFFNLANGDFFQDWSNTGLITTTTTSTDPNNTGWENVPSIIGYLGDTFPSTSPTNLDASAQTNAALGSFNVFANQTSVTFNSGGVAEFQIANPTVALQGSATADNPSLVLYLDSAGRQNLHLELDLRHLDTETDYTNQQLAIQYRVGDTGTWTNIPPQTPGTGIGANDYLQNPFPNNTVPQTIHISLDLPSALNNQDQVELRFATVNAPSSDEWLGLDNIHVTSQTLAQDVTPPTLAGTTPAEGALTSPASNITLQFSETVKAGAGAFTITGDAGDTHVISAADTTQVSYSGTVVTLNPTSDLNPNEAYHLTIASGAVTDNAGNAYAGTTSPVDFQTYNPTPHIYEIQGAGHTSAFNGLSVTTTGIVTAIDTTGSKGFWMQDETGDGNIATSDGIFVFTGVVPTIHVGDKVSVAGTVDEYAGSDPNNLTITELDTSNANVTVIGTGTIEATIIGAGGRLPPTEVIEDDNFTSFDPTHDAVDFYESLEGMKVTVTNAQAVDSTISGTTTWIVADNGAEATGMNARGGITIGPNDLNPEKIEVFADSGVSTLAPNAVVGDHLGNVTGVISYFGGNYELVPTAIDNTTSAGSVPKEVTTLSGDADHVTIGAFNLENLDPTDPDSKFQGLAQEIVQNQGSPDILGVEEIQDADGAGAGTNYSGSATLDKLVAAINAAGGPHYAYVEIDPTANNQTGGEPNGNIRQAFLYNTDRVAFVDGSLKNLVDTNLSDGDAYNNSRKPLVANFTFNGETITAIDVHNYSRGGSDEEFGKDQPAAISGDQRRTDQTTPVKQYVDQLEAANPNANIAVMGDFNGFQFETSLTQLTAGGALKQLSDLLDPTDRFSYSFDGNMQEIDHLLVSPNLQDGAAFDIVHVNSGVSDAVRPTDHDPIVSRILVNTGPVATGDTGSVAENQSVTINVLANDSDINTHDTKTITSVSATSAGGHVSIVNGQVVYAADADSFDLLTAGQHTNDTFTYVMADQEGVTSSATVTVTVNGVADGPTQTGGVGNDVLTGTALDEKLDGGAGNDTLSGGAGADTLLGGAGNDSLSGGAGIDSISAGDGNDTISGGGGNDVMLGGRGNDIFVFNANFGHDVVTDFASGQDHIQFLGVGFASYGDVMAHTAQSGANVIITDAAGDTLQLNNFNASGLHQSDFLFT